jgi:hypothetical protein
MCIIFHTHYDLLRIEITNENGERIPSTAPQPQ